MSNDTEEIREGDSNQIFGVCPICARYGDKEKKQLFKCEYCGELFCEKHKEPTVVMSFERYMELSKDPKIGPIIEREWRKDGHPCIEYSGAFWEKLRKREEQYYQLISTLLSSSKKLRIRSIWDPKIWELDRKEHEQGSPCVPPPLVSRLGCFMHTIKRRIAKLSRLLLICTSAFWKFFMISVLFLVAVHVFVGTESINIFFVLKRSVQIGALAYIVCVLTRTSSVVRAVAKYCKRALPWALVLLVVLKPGVITTCVTHVANVDERMINKKLSELNISLTNLGSIVHGFFDVATRYPSLTGDFYEYGEYTISRSYSFLYKGRVCEITVNIPSELYERAKFTERHVTKWCYAGVCSDVNWAKYWINMALSPAERPIIISIVNQLRACATTDNEFVEAATLFVQSLDYDWEKFFTPLSEGARFPVETLVEERGVCGDKALLLAAILYYDGFETALLEYKQESHMAVGVKCTCPNVGEYCFIEPTQPNPIGHIPEEYVSGIELISFPAVYRFPKSEGKYYDCLEMDYASLNEIKERVIALIEREFSLEHKPVLDSAIARNVVPHGYTDGHIWTFELPKGPSSFAIAEFHRCHIQNRCREHLTDNRFIDGVKTSKYFGVAVYDSGTKYVLKILLTK